MRHQRPTTGSRATSATLLVCSWLLCLQSSAGLAGLKPPHPQPGEVIFNRPEVSRLSLQIATTDLAALRKDPRKNVSAVLREGTNSFFGVEVHLKGSSSFRPIDEKPGLTLTFPEGGLFHGLHKLHLNNSVEDPSYLNEQLGHDLFQAAGLPAPRVAYAEVKINERRLGLYVLKEGFNQDLLAGYLEDASGNIYESDLGHDVDQPMKRNSGNGPKQLQADRKALAKVALDPEVASRWQAFAPVLDREEFLKFMILEVMVCHRDGYCLARNNYRLGQDAATGRMFFLPHGMDQLFGKSDFTWKPFMAGVVAASVMETSEGKQRYEAEFPQLFQQVFRVGKLQARVDELLAQLRPVLPAAEFAAVEQEATLVKERVARRYASLEKQLHQPPLPAPDFTRNSTAPLTGWLATDAPGHGEMDEGKSPEGLPALHISTHSPSSASWRTRVILPRGRYEFQGRIKTSELEPLPFGKHQGAGLRISGTPGAAFASSTPSSWRLLITRFEVEADHTEKEFICELRAQAGEAWFDLASLSLRKLVDTDLSAGITPH